MSFPIDRPHIRLDPGDRDRIFDPSRTTARGTPAPRGRVSDKPLPSPFTVAIDTREQTPFTFLNINADSNKSYRPLVISTERTTLAQGDYSIIGPDGTSYADQIAIERKSKADLYGTLGQGRERFERELQRLTSLVRFPIVMIEAEWSEIIRHPPEFSAMNPKTVFRSIIAWKFRYPTIHWLTMPGRRMAELATYRLFERFWKGFTSSLRSGSTEPENHSEDSDT